MSERKIKISHIVNPVPQGVSRELDWVQPFTFESILHARNLALERGVAEIELFATQFKDENQVLPLGFLKAPELTRCVGDLAQFRKQRKLPLLGDILHSLQQASDAELFVYTNADIGLYPDFYCAISRLAERGFDAFSITRQTIKVSPAKVKDLKWIFRQSSNAGHPGHDCMVFRRELLERFSLFSVCIGVPFADSAFICALSSVARKFRIFPHLPLTFHFNDDKAWAQDVYSDYLEFNRREAVKVLRNLLNQGEKLSKPAMDCLKMWEEVAENPELQGYKNVRAVQQP